MNVRWSIIALLLAVAGAVVVPAGAETLVVPVRAPADRQPGAGAPAPEPMIAPERRAPTANARRTP